jgi:hypothetical protein
MKFIYHDGGREAAGFRGKTGDCVVRAIAIATRMPYQQVYEMVNKAGAQERESKRRRNKSSARTGVYKPTTRKLLESLAWE